MWTAYEKDLQWFFAFEKQLAVEAIPWEPSELTVNRDIGVDTAQQISNDSNWVLNYNAVHARYCREVRGVQYFSWFKFNLCLDVKRRWSWNDVHF